jgi:integrase
VQSVLDAMLAEGASTASVVKCHRVIASSLKQAVRWQLLAANPAEGVSPPIVRKPRLRIPSSEEMRRLVDAATETDYALPVLLAAMTGMRRSEVLSLRWHDVEGDLLRVVDAKTDTGRRTVHLPASTVAALKRPRREQNERRLRCGEAWHDTDLVCDRGDGGRVNPDSLSHAFADIAESVELGDVRLHDLRHGFATALLKAGVNVKIVSEALGHARSSFTQDVYQHVLPGMGEQVAMAIEDALGREEIR